MRLAPTQLALRVAGRPTAMPSASQGGARRRVAAAAATLPIEKQQQPLAAAADAPVVLQYTSLVRGQLVRRYKRFLGDVRLEAAATAAEAAAAAPPAAGTAAAGGAGSCDEARGEVAAAQAGITTVHVPNTGPMTGLLGALPAPALLSVSADPKRKYPHTLEWLRPDGGQGSWVGTHSAKANAMVRHLLEARLLPGLPPYGRVQAEVKYGADGKSRVDFVLHPSSEASSSSDRDAADAAGSGAPAKRRRSARSARAAAGTEEAAAVTAGPASDAAADQAATDPPPAGQRGACFVEVKSVTLAEDRGQGGGHIALFPDTVSERAQRHLRELTALAAGGGSAALVFVVQRDDCAAFAPCHEKDPEYGRLVREAAAAGVALLPVVCSLDEAAGAVRYRGTLPLDLDYKWKAR
ncbi:hypothetical protein ABPG75_001652 [Micractinium tetrahymenae]